MKPSAQRAVIILQTMSKEMAPALLAYWVAPNTILTLSGARAYADGVFWDDQQRGLLEQWREEIEKSLAVIRRTIKLQWAEAVKTDARPGETYAGYDLITREGLEYVLENTALLPGLTKDDIKDDADLSDIQQMMSACLRSQKRFADFSKEDLNHILFGILVGYPDEAIVQSVTQWHKEPSSSNETHMQADIRGADYYICPQPVYEYPRSLANDPGIKKHEQLWSKILMDYYQSDFHKQLEVNRDFANKVRQLGMSTQG